MCTVCNSMFQVGSGAIGESISASIAIHHLHTDPNLVHITVQHTDCTVATENCSISPMVLQ